MSSSDSASWSRSASSASMCENLAHPEAFFSHCDLPSFYEPSLPKGEEAQALVCGQEIAGLASSLLQVLIRNQALERRLGNESLAFPSAGCSTTSLHFSSTPFMLHPRAA